MKFFKNPLVYFLIFVLLTATSCSMCRTKEPDAVVDRTERQVVVYGMDDDEDTFAKLLNGFEKVSQFTDVVYKKFDNFEEYEKLILDELAEGQGPDIFMMPNSWFVKNRKKLSPMPESKGTVDQFKSIFVDVAAKDLVITDDSGIEQVYGMPLYVDTLALYYNKDQFEDRIPETGKPSMTWDGIKSDVVSLMKPDENGFKVSGIAMGNTDGVTYSSDILYGLMIQGGVSFYDPLMSKALFAESNSYAAQDALSLYLSFSDPTQLHYSWDKDVASEYLMGDVSAFVTGEASMMFGYASTYDFILSQRTIAKAKGSSVIDEGAIKVAPFPQLVAPTDSTKKRDAYARYYAYGVARTSKHPDIAWDLLTYLTSPDVEAVYFDATHKPTSRRDMIDAEKLHPMYGTFVEQLGYAESFPVIDYLGFDKTMRTVIDEAGATKKVKQALDAAQAKVNDVLPMKGYRVPLNEEYYKDKTPVVTPAPTL